MIHYIFTHYHTHTHTLIYTHKQHPHEFSQLDNPMFVTVSDQPKALWPYSILCLLFLEQYSLQGNGTMALLMGCTSYLAKYRPPVDDACLCGIFLFVVEDNHNVSAILKDQSIINCNCFRGLFSIFIVSQKYDEP